MKILRNGLCLAVILSSSATLAGGDSGWIEAKTCDVAMDAALKAVSAVVKSRGEGCIGRAEGSATETKLSEDGKKCSVKAYYSEHAGSCGQNSPETKAACKAIGVSC